jgi:hypothetical protein
MLCSDRELPEILVEVARLGARLLLQAALEAEVTAFLGRDRYQRAAASGEWVAASFVMAEAGLILLVQAPGGRVTVRASAASSRCRKRSWTDRLR